MPHDAPQPDDLRASVIDRFGKVATTPGQERKFPVGPESAKRLGYDACKETRTCSAIEARKGGGKGRRDALPPATIDKEIVTSPMPAVGVEPTPWFPRRGF
jgi:hypothetical protein